MKKLLFLLAMVVGFSTSAFAQTLVKGTVVEKSTDEPLVGVTVHARGTNVATATDVDGKFTINVPAGVKKLAFSYVGMRTIEMDVAPNMTVAMEPTNNNLDEVVVVAYGTASKESLTGAVSVINDKEIAKRPVTSVTQALEGMAPGVQVNGSTGTPGDSPSILIRGINTVNGTTSEEFEQIPVKLRKIAECKNLIAYLREAIKERERLFKEIKNYENKEARLALVKPNRVPTITVDDVLKSWSVGQLNKYYELEAKCAVFGKFIHEGGSFNAQRKAYHATLQRPITVDGKGRDFITHQHVPSLSAEEIDDMFFKLQDEYRSTQAEFNGMKHTIDELIEKDDAEKTASYKKDYEIYFGKLEKIEIEEHEFINAQLKEAQKLKIVIPNNLQGIYSEINNLVK